MADQTALTAQLIKSLIAQQQQTQQIQPPASSTTPFGALAVPQQPAGQSPDQTSQDQPGIISGLWDGLSNGAKAQLAQAKWVAGGMNGPPPPQYTGGPSYP